MKAFPTVVPAPCVISRCQNKVLVPRAVLWLLLASVVCQLGGNVLFQVGWWGSR
jgi:hypothetical protein